jgi:eukaryotic-like serine/threonine-protein kinase
MSESPKNKSILDSEPQSPSVDKEAVGAWRSASPSTEVTVNLPPPGTDGGPSNSIFDTQRDPSIAGGQSVDGPAEENDDALSDATVDVASDVPDSLSRTVDLPVRLHADDATFVLASESHPTSPEGKSRVGSYEIDEILGRGAVGVVYKARHLGLKRTVALKMLLAGAHASPNEVMRFHTEAEAVARLQHPNIVQVYEVGTHEALSFFALEFVEGGSLTQHMAGKPLLAAEAARFMEALARAMHYAHEHNILHRDLKPANILLSRDGVPKITDFGLAKRLEDNESTQTRTGTVMGTPSYMSPEQAEGNQRAIGPRSDQYSLGAILYELVTGRPPFLGTTLLDTLEQVRSKEPVPPRQLQPSVPRDLEIICLKCLQKEPAKRYAHAAELADDLKRFLNGEAIRARPVSRPERVWRWCRRNPRNAGLVAAVAVLAVLLAVSGGALGLRLLRERQAVTRIHDQAEQRMEQATAAIAVGDVRRAKDLLHWSDPLLESASDLNEQRSRWHKLKESIEVYGEFKDLLDKARFALIFGARSSRTQLEQGQQYGRKLRTVYEAIEQEKTPLPPLNAVQEQLFKEDVFDMFLVSALLESELTQKAEPARRQQVAQQALDWLERADKILPGMRTLYPHRSGFHAILGQSEAAEDDLKRARAIQPDSAVDHFWHGYAEHVRGEAARSRGDLAKARTHYRQEIAEYAAVLRHHPDHFWGYLNWAVAKTQLGDLEDALIGFTTCIRLRPDFPWPYNNRGTVHLRLKQYDQAIRDYSTALEHSPEYVEARANRALAYVEQGNLDQALKDCNHIVEQDPRHAPAYWHRAECYRRRKQYERALADFAHLLALNENAVDVCLKRAAVYREMNRLDDALRDYDQIVVREPKNAWGLYTRAGLRVQRGDYRQAVDDYTAAIALQPRALEPYRDRAAVRWLYLKDFDDALADWRQVARLRPNDPEPYRCLGVIYLGRRQYEWALDELDNALTRRADYPEALWAKAQIYLWQGDAKEALKILDPLAQQLPSDAVETLNLRGDIYQRLRRLEDAAADYRRLIQLRSNLPEAYVSLAQVYLKQAKLGQARECFEQLVAANRQSAAAYLARGRFLRDQGQFETARQDAQQAARCDPKSVLPALLQASITAVSDDPAAAVAEAQRLLDKAAKDNGQVLYAAVQVWSLASAAKERAGKPELARQYADRAAALLAQTLDKGFHDLLYPEHNRMIDDPALEAIRQHPKARDLIAHRSLD